ncbi:hypothetical protein EVAR_79577_1 [Eumeta japonica]|uniref:Uncharacterized protein n=1 Tax=Eumeta variegata TaxID=151549 RepID=A0A4C1UF24_EUMVA|nr:hypothetical protein EVAR_79577_1 [Eumeta japonica]
MNTINSECMYTLFTPNDFGIALKSNSNCDVLRTLQKAELKSELRVEHQKEQKTESEVGLKIKPQSKRELAIYCDQE